MTSNEDHVSPQEHSQPYAALRLGFELCLIGICYFVFARLGLTLASLHPSASPIWPATGIALGLMLLRGYRIWPAILTGAVAANAAVLITPTAGAVAFATALGIGLGNMAEALLGTYLIRRWSGGRCTFDSPSGVIRFAAIALLATTLSATIGTASLLAGGFAHSASLGMVWLTWCLGDLAGAVLVTPLIVLWAGIRAAGLTRGKVLESVCIYAVAGIIGVITFGPWLGPMERRAPFALLVMLPLLWSALRRGRRDTATAAFILAGFAVSGTLAGGGAFPHDTLNESFLQLLVFIVGVTIPSLALSADVTVRRRSREELNRQVDARTAALIETNRALQAEVEHRRRVEAELDEQTHHLVEAQRLANLGSWSRSLPDNTVVWSDQLYEIFGVARDADPPGSFESFLNRVHPDEREAAREQSLGAIRRGEGFRCERRIVRPNGEIRYTQNCVEIVKDEAGRVVGMHGICLDITERKLAQMALERTREQLAQLQKMEALGQLTGGIAHDFNNLLMIVSGHAEMLRRRLSDSGHLRSIDAILDATRRGESLTRQLLTFSRRQPVNPVCIDLRQRIQAMRAMLTSSLRGNIRLIIDLPDGIFPVEADIAEFELALVNIAVNARDAMPDGGTFTISARNVPAGHGRAGQPTDDHVALSFADTGTGIAPDVLKKIFDPFFTTKAVGKGTGLGLSQVYGFSHQSGGSVGVSSEVGHGTTLTIYLPRSSAIVAASEAGRATSDALHADGTVLLVEDNPDVADVTAGLLEQTGYCVVRAANAHEALAILERGDAIDIMVSDIVMPNGMNGVHLAQVVSETYPAIKIVLITGYSDVAAAGQTRFPVLRKPFERPALERAILKVTDGNPGLLRAVGRAAG